MADTHGPYTEIKSSDLIYEYDNEKLINIHTIVKVNKKSVRTNLGLRLYNRVNKFGEVFRVGGSYYDPLYTIRES